MTNQLNQKLISAINVQGILLQEKCADIFAKEGYKVITEYPVMFPKPSFGNFGKDVVIDIWARKNLTNVQIDFLVECKKADPKLKNWVFFKDKFSYSIGNDNIKFVKGPGDNWNTNTILVDIQKELKLEHGDRCFMGIELKEKFKKGPEKDDTVATTQRISDASYQAVQAANGTFDEYGEFYSKLQSTPLQKNEQNLFILPLVVTTANLLVADYDIDKISENGGLDAKDVSFAEKDFILYNYSIPGHIRFPMLEGDIPNRTLETRLGYKKTLIIICSVNYLKKFINKFK
ncbi:MAG: hypothetical protein A2126_01035 [Candidatus Woykebacteria bacterium GWB1_45_5]|uniref:Uncharacterized protein n=2 Tax=Candidatus Woykeibacteriota TaxID=1817899 RepID=A0A1G1W2M8_9BACT|nr:MAG: hypothetical protein A2113_01290 [Candidatus Woykebacteria bacterium GWA1_44_8]OGY23994.1 MAG: hypothetical protein A2126_01035 [Candidatus Woykebacteria bacterium GWB1_45_5]